MNALLLVGQKRTMACSQKPGVGMLQTRKLAVGETYKSGRRQFRQRRIECGSFTGSKGGAVLDRPGLNTDGWSSSSPQTDSGDGASERDQGRGPGGGSWRVVLLDSPNHTEKRVVSALTTVVGLDEAHATNCFVTSRQLGQAFVASSLLEIAEFWQQELYRRQCKVTLEPDTSVI